MSAQTTTDSIDLKWLSLGDTNELSVKEWKKFKYFESQLEDSKISKLKQAKQLTSYAKDSLKILTVKLVAIKVLDDKNLLDRDIAKNTAYYVDLLQEMKESSLHPEAYLFLENKVILFKQEELEQSLGLSKWINVGLGVLALLLAFVVIKKSYYKTSAVQELSRQENTIRTLIEQGKTNKEIASELFISLSTVKTHITNIYSKLNVSNRQELLQR